MAIGGNYGPPLIDFTPLANLADPIIAAMEKKRQTDAMLALNSDLLPKPSLTALGADSTTSPATTNAPVAPSIGPRMAGGGRAMAMPADPATEAKFLSTVKAGGLTNPYGVAALAAHVNAESGFSPANFVRTWSDPSESGQAGTSGGALSWRGDRLAKMQQATAGMDPVEAQAKYALTERPDVTLALQNAKSLEEAHNVLAASQQYAGFNRPGGENAKRLAMAQSYLPRVGGALADVPAEGATNAQFAIPGQTPAATAPTPATGPLPQSITGLTPERAAKLQAAIQAGGPVQAAALTELAQLRKTPEHVAEFAWARRNGLTTAATPAAYELEKQKPDSVIQQYNLAKSQGFTGTILDFKEKVAKAGATNVNIGPNGEQFGNPEPGLVWKRTPDGKVALDERGAPIAIPYQGGKAFKDAEKAAETAKSKEGLEEQKRTIVSDDIDRALGLINSKGVPVTAGGSILSGVPGTRAHDLQEALTSVRANISFERLQAMRDASTTGASGLGQVTEGEHRLLQSVMGSLAQSQTKENLIYNLKRLKVAQEEIINHGLGDGSKLKERLAELRISNKEAQAAGLLDNKNKPIPGALSPTTAIPEPAVAHLRANPSLKDDFDKKYGEGAAARVLSGAL